MTQTTVAVRVFRETDSQDRWMDFGVEAHIPIFVSGDLAIENISKRVHMLFLRDNNDLVRARWNYRGEEKGVWVDRDLGIEVDS